MIDDTHKNKLFFVIFTDEPAAVQHHDPPPDSRKIMLYFKIFKLHLFQKYFSQKFSKLGYIPLPVPQCEKRNIFYFCGRNFERLIERLICMFSAEIFIQHDDRLLYGGKHPLKIDKGIFQYRLCPL